MIVYPFSFIKSAGGGLDPDAQAYLDAVVATGGTVNGTIETAVNTLFEDLKSAGVYSKLDMLMPMIGSTKSSILINALEPTSSTWTWTEYGTTLTYNNSGMTFNNSGVLKSNFTLGDFTHSNSGSSHFSIYASDDGTSSNFNGVITGFSLRFACGFAGGAPYLGQYQNGGSYGAPDPEPGYWLVGKTAYDTIEFWVDGIQYVDDSDSNTEAYSTLNMALGTIAWNAFPDGLYPAPADNSVYCTMTIGGGLTDTEIGDITDIITTFNTTLNRA